MYRVSFWLFGLAILSVVISSARAQEVACPQKIGTIQNAFVYKEVERVFRHIYKIMGCELTLVELPAKRGIASFNNNRIDGEMLRTPAVETLYKRDFVRSLPLFTIRFGLWGPTDKIERIGYLRGYVVHQKAADHYVEAGRMVQSFSTNEQMFAALQRGALDAVLTGELAWNAFSAGGHGALEGGIQETLATLRLHHYLAPAYTPFLKKFDQYLNDHTPF